jgi:type IV secretion system protein VirD4
MKGMFMGYFDDEPMHYPPGAGNAAIFGIPRSGKAVFLLVRILLTFMGSIFCVDPRGQLAAITARYRRDILGQDVSIISTFEDTPDYLKHIAEGQFNPLAKWDVRNPLIAAKAMGLMEALMPLSDHEAKHWTTAARLGGAAVAVWAKEKAGDDATLVDVYRMTANVDDFQKYCRHAVTDTSIPFVALNLSSYASMTPEDRERRDVIATMSTHLGWIASYEKVLSGRSMLDFEEHKHKPKTTYLTTPAEGIAAAMPLVKTIVDGYGRAMLGSPGDLPNIGILDEYKVAASDLTSISTLGAMGAGCGCQLIYVLHSLEELRSTKEGMNTLSNCGLQIYLPPRNDLNTANHISSMCGMRDVTTLSRSYNPKDNSCSTSSQGVAAWQAPALMDLPRNTCLVFCDQVPGYIIAGLKPYYQTPELFNANGTPKFDKDPYYKP